MHAPALSITAGQSVISGRLTDAAAIARAALTCAEAGSEREAVRIAMKFDTLLHEADTLHRSVCLISRLQRDAVPDALSIRLIDRISATALEPAVLSPAAASRSRGFGRWQTHVRLPVLEGSTMPTDPPLSPQHRDLLAAAARRRDKLLIPPARVTGGVRRRLGEKLVALGLAQAVAAEEGPIWGNAPGGDTLGLRLTEAGLAIGAAATGTGGDGMGEPDQEQVPAPIEPRSWTKIARVLALLRRGEGADLHTLSSVTAWLPHTTRAALTGLRRKGYAILSERRETDGRTVYRIAARAAPEPASTTAGTVGTASSASASN